MISLYRFGHEGNEVSCEGIAQWAGVSVGMVIKSANRAMEAVFSRHDTAIRWVSEEEKEETKSWVDLDFA